jgi:hypothetical protein
MSEIPYTVECFLCKKSFQFGPHIYHGRKIPAWGMIVCTGCYTENWDGIVPEVQTHLIPYLRLKGIEVKPNQQGRIDWPS